MNLQFTHMRHRFIGVFSEHRTQFAYNMETSPQQEYTLSLSKEERDRIYYERFLVNHKQRDESMYEESLEGMREQIKEAAAAGKEIRIPVEGREKLTEDDKEELAAFIILAKKLGYRIGEFDHQTIVAVAPIEQVETPADMQNAPVPPAQEAPATKTPPQLSPEQTSGTVPHPPEQPRRFFDAPTFESLGKQVKEEIVAMPPREKKSFFTGIAEWGYRVQEWKGKELSRVYEWVADTFKEKGKTFEEQGTMVRFYHALGESYKHIAKKGHEDRTKLADGKGLVGLMKKSGGIGTLVGNATLYGRTVYDIAHQFFGMSTANPLRYVTITAMMISRSAEAAKEAMLQSAEKIEAERITDAEKAAEEAWRIYEEAKRRNPQDEVTKEALKLAYAKDLPAHILDRFIEKPESISSTLMQKIAESHIRRKTKDIYGALLDIEHSEETPKEKQRAIEGILSRNADFLRDVDRMVTKAGTVDTVAYGSKLLEKGGRAVVTAMAIETLAEGTWRLGRWTSDFIAGGGVHRLAEAASDIAGKGNRKIGELYEYLTFNANGSPKTEGLKTLATDVAETNLPKEILIPPEALKAATIGKGEGIEHAFIRQIKLHPEQFGFKGNTSNAETLNQFAGVKAHKLAQEFGYIAYKDGTMIETRIHDEDVGYLLNTTQEGHITLEKIGLREGGASEYTYIKKPFITDEEGRVLTREIIQKEDAIGVRDAAEAGMLEEKARAITDDALRQEAIQHAAIRDTDETRAPGSHKKIETPKTEHASESAVLQEPKDPLKEIGVRDADAVPAPQSKESGGRSVPEGAYDATIEKSGITVTKELIAKAGFSERILGQIDQNQFENLTSSHISALDLAARDVGIKGADTEITKQYLEHALSTFQSGNKKNIAQWIDEAYRSLLVDDMKRGIRLENDKPITQEYIDSQTARLQELLLGRAAHISSVTPEMHSYAIEKATDVIQSDIAKYDKDIIHLNETLTKLQNPSLRQSLESDKLRLLIEKAGLEEILKNPEKFARVESDGSSVTFEGGTYKVIPRPEDVSGISAFEKPFRYTVPIPKE